MSAPLASAQAWLDDIEGRLSAVEVRVAAIEAAQDGEDSLWSVKRAALYLDLTEDAARKLIGRGALPKFHLGGLGANRPVRTLRSAVIGYAVQQRNGDRP